MNLLQRIHRECCAAMRARLAPVRVAHAVTERESHFAARRMDEFPRQAQWKFKIATRSSGQASRMLARIAHQRRGARQ